MRQLSSIEPKNDELLRTAIEQRRLIRLVYQDKERLVEPHDYGVHNGSVKLLAYQIAGASSGRLPSWKWMHADQISDIRLLEKTFPGGRPIASGKHSKWDELYVRVKPADTDAIEATSLPLDEDVTATWDAATLAGVIADLGYPQFGHLRGSWKKNPALVLLNALSMDDLEVLSLRLLSWLVVHYHDLDWNWSIPKIKQRNLQNRLGFIVTLGRRVAEKENYERTAAETT